MDTTVVVLGSLLVLVIVYMIFKEFFSGETKLKNQLHYKKSNPAIPSDELTQPNAKRVYYCIWVFVNSWNTSSEKIIFRRNNDTILWLDKDKAQLYAAIGTSLPEGLNSPNDNKFIITNNFPLQKWVCILVSIDNTIADFYLDGKLVKSRTLTHGLGASTAEGDGSHAEQDISFTSESGWDGYFSNFERKPEPMDPKGAYDKYMEANGGKTLAAALGNYSVNMSLLKDNVVTSNFTLF
jgi:hypothetical protein